MSGKAYGNQRSRPPSGHQASSLPCLSRHRYSACSLVLPSQLKLPNEEPWWCALAHLSCRHILVHTPLCRSSSAPSLLCRTSTSTTLASFPLHSFFCQSHSSHVCLAAAIRVVVPYHSSCRVLFPAQALPRTIKAYRISRIEGHHSLPPELRLEKFLRSHREPLLCVVRQQLQDTPELSLTSNHPRWKAGRARRITDLFPVPCCPNGRLVDAPDP
jgi:hypothetical protein